MKQPDSALNILFEDNHLFIVSKPAGLPTQSSPTHKDSLEEAAKQFLKEKYQKKGNVFCYPIHRLDTVTSGIVVFAKSSKALSRLNEMQRHHQIKKTYLAIIEGHLKESEGEMTHNIVHDHLKATIVSKAHPGAQLCRLYWKKVQEGPHTTLLCIQLETGRYHQIRAQFSAIGHPVLGDNKYGATIAFHKGTIALHAAMIELAHPVGKEPLTFWALPPKFWPMTINSSSAILKNYS